MDNNYVSVEGDSYRIIGTRVSLDSVVYDYLSGPFSREHRGQL